MKLLFPLVGILYIEIYILATWPFQHDKIYSSDILSNVFQLVYRLIYKIMQMLYNIIMYL